MSSLEISPAYMPQSLRTCMSAGAKILPKRFPRLTLLNRIGLCSDFSNKSRHKPRIFVWRILGIKTSITLNFCMCESARTWQYGIWVLSFFHHCAAAAQHHSTLSFFGIFFFLQTPFFFFFSEKRSHKAIHFSKNKKKTFIIKKVEEISICSAQAGLADSSALAYNNFLISEKIIIKTSAMETTSSSADKLLQFAFISFISISIR